MSIIKIRDKDGNEVAVGGKNGVDGKSAYQTAVDNGFAGTEEEWLASLRGYPAGGLEGQALVKSTADDTNAVKWGPWPSNPNLLLNWDFRNPVNRNGQSEYTAAGLSIDRWQLNNGTLTVLDKYISITAADSKKWYFSQILEKYDKFVGHTYTLSILLADNEVAFCTFELTPVENTINNTSVLWTVLGTQIHAEIWRLAPKGDLLVQFNSSQTSVTTNIIAAKLELGDQQTLAHQDADGNWVLNDPPNYDLQYTLCSQYSPKTGEFVGSQHSNPNLLDNWYFADPINQRGQSEYTATGYTIDRWVNSTNLSVNIMDGYIRITKTVAKANPGFYQIFEKPITSSSGSVTISILYRTNDMEVMDFRISCLMGSQTLSKSISPSSKWNVAIFNIPVSQTAVIANIRAVQAFSSTEAGSYIDVVAVKFEEGPVSTLAHKVDDETIGYDGWILNDPLPDYGLELAKCQRYQVVIGGNRNYEPVGNVFVRTNGSVELMIPLCNMRALPVVTFHGTFRVVTNTAGVIESDKVTVNSSQLSSQNLLLNLSGFSSTVANGFGWLDTRNAQSFVVFDANL